MGTLRNVKITDVSSSEIKEVLNSQSPVAGTIPEDNRVGEDIFTDNGTEDAPAIYEQGIDPRFIERNDDGSLKTNFVSKSFKAGNWRNYGWSDGAAEGEDYPYIYWKNIIDYLDTDHTPDDNISKLYGDAEAFPIITMAPNSDIAAPLLNSNIQNSKYLAAAYQSALFNNNRLTSTEVATKVGIDYLHYDSENFEYVPGDSYDGSSPEFRIKVTPYLCDGVTPREIFKRVYNSNTKKFDVELWFGIVLSVGLEKLGLPPGVVAVITDPPLPGKDRVKRRYKVEIDGEPPSIDPGTIKVPGGTNPQEPWTFVKGQVETIITYIDEIIKGTGSGAPDGPPLPPGWPTETPPKIPGTSLFKAIGPYLAGIAAFIGLVLIADLIWDMVNNPAEILASPYQYQQSILGTYNFNDIRDSLYSYAWGNKYYQTDKESINDALGKIEELITNGGKYTDAYTLNDFNYEGTPFSSTNQIAEFPTNTSSGRGKYLNWDFFAKGIQYDVHTPPPIIEYLVELEPIKNCRLHPDKTHAFGVRVVPDIYYAPKFTITTAVVQDNVNRLYKNTSITFKNARFADHIFLVDTSNWSRENSSFISFKEGNKGFIRGELFIPYYNRMLQSASNGGANTPSYILTYDGNDISTQGRDIFAPSPDADVYYVEFMQEADPNILYNPFFRVEKDDTAGRRLGDMRKFWEYTSDVTIQNGAAYKTVNLGTSGFLRQSLPALGNSTNSNWVYYVLKLELVKNAGNIYLATSGTCFTNLLFGLEVQGRFGNYGRYAIDPATAGVAIRADNIELLESKNYFLILESQKNPLSKMLQFTFSSDFNGYIKSCKLQRLPHSETGVLKNRKGESISKRGDTSIQFSYAQPAQKFRWQSEFLTTKTIMLRYRPVTNGVYNFDVQLRDAAVNQVNITWYKSNRTNETESHAGGLIGPLLNISKTVSDGTYIIYAIISLDLPEVGAFDDRQLSSFTCNDKKLEYIEDYEGSLFDADIDLSDTSLGYYGAKQFFPTSFSFRLNTLDISNTLVKDNIASITSIKESFKANGAYQVFGDLGSIISIPTLELDNTNISSYVMGQPNYTDVTEEPYIVWKNSNITNVSNLNKLLVDLDFSATENGYLDISGDNPAILELTALESIDSLVAKGWNVIYNTQYLLVDGNGDYIIDSNGNYVTDGEVVTIDSAAP